MQPMPDLHQLAKDIHAENLKWWQDLETGEPIQTPSGQKEMLMISEVAEAMEGLRKDLNDDKLPHRKMAEVEAADYVIRVLDFAAAHEAELSDEIVLPTIQSRMTEAEDMLAMCTEAEDMLAMCRCALDLYAEGPYMVGDPGLRDNVCECISAAMLFCERFDYDLWAAVDEKRAYNRERPDHKIDSRKGEHGKKW